MAPSASAFGTTAGRPSEKRRGGRSCDGDNDPNKNAGGFAATLAGLTRMLMFALKGNLKKGLIKAVLRKKAFLTIGQRTASAALSEHLVASPSSDKNKAAAGAKPAVSQQSTFQTKTLGLVKNGLLGLAVFGVYDILIFRTWPSKNSESKDKRPSHPPILTSDLKLVWMHAMVSPNAEMAPLYAHFAAGALSGFAQSMIMDTWELTSYWWYHHRHRFASPQHLNGINFHFIFRRLVHHSVGYATLFGCYETIRRRLFSIFYDYVTSGDPSVPRTLQLLEKYNLIVNENGVLNMTCVPMATSFVAGGFAGQLHYIVSCYTRHWKLLTLRSSEKTLQKQKHRRIWPKLPKFRPTAAAFMPTALCFVAFQYGGELTEKIVDEDDARHPFPVYIHNPI